MSRKEKIYCLMLIVGLMGIGLSFVPQDSYAMNVRCFNDGKIVYHTEAQAAYLSDGILVIIEEKSKRHIVAYLDCIITFPIEDKRDAAIKSRKIKEVAAREYTH